MKEGEFIFHKNFKDWVKKNRKSIKAYSSPIFSEKFNLWLSM